MEPAIELHPFDDLEQKPQGSGSIVRGLTVHWPSAVVTLGRCSDGANLVDLWDLESFSAHLQRLVDAA